MLLLLTKYMYMQTKSTAYTTGTHSITAGVCKLRTTVCIQYALFNICKAIMLYGDAWEQKEMKVHVVSFSSFSCSGAGGSEGICVSPRLRPACTHCRSLCKLHFLETASLRTARLNLNTAGLTRHFKPLWVLFPANGTRAQKPDLVAYPIGNMLRCKVGGEMPASTLHCGESQSVAIKCTIGSSPRLVGSVVSNKPLHSCRFCRE